MVDEANRNATEGANKRDANGDRGPGRMVGGFVRMEVGLGSILNLLVILTLLGSVLLSYEGDRATVAASIGLLQQRFSDFEATTESQLQAITAQVTSLPATNSQMSQLADHLHAIDGRLDSISSEINALGRHQATLNAEVDGILRGDRGPASHGR